MSIKIVQVNEAGIQLEIAKALFLAYQTELDENLCFQSFEKELENPLTKYGTDQNGALLLAYYNDEVVGCVALQNLGACNCEMKRLYVKPEYRKYKIGAALVQEIILCAGKNGYTKMKLDTLTKLVPAIELYKKYGFVETTAYYENPLPTVVYMEKELAV